MSNGAWATLVGLSLLWGGSFLFNAMAVAELPPLVVVWFRVAVAAAAMTAVLAAQGRRLPTDARTWRAFAVMGLFNNAVPFTLIVWAQQSIPGGLASILNAMTPVSTALLAHFLTRDERLGPARAAGVGFGFLGVTLLVGWDALAGVTEAVPAELAVLGAGLGYATTAIYARRFRGMGIEPAVLTAGQTLMSTLILLPPMLAVAQPWTLPVPGTAAIGSVLALALLSTALGYNLYFRVLGQAGAGSASLVTFMVPPSAILLDWLVLGEVPEPRHFAGLGVIVLGLACIDGRALRLLPRRLRLRDG